MNAGELMNMVAHAQETADIAAAQVNVAHDTINEVVHDIATVYTRADSISHRVDVASYDISQLRSDLDTMRHALTLILGAGWDSPDGPPPEPQPVEDDDIRGFMGEVLYGQP